MPETPHLPDPITVVQLPETDLTYEAVKSAIYAQTRYLYEHGRLGVPTKAPQTATQASAPAAALSVPGSAQASSQAAPSGASQPPLQGAAATPSPAPSRLKGLLVLSADLLEILNRRLVLRTPAHKELPHFITPYGNLLVQLPAKGSAEGGLAVLTEPRSFTIE